MFENTYLIKKLDFFYNQVTTNYLNNILISKTVEKPPFLPKKTREINNR